MNNPKISIVTIAFNSVSTIERTIRSVVEQDYANREYLIVDGGSTDGTQNVVKKHICSINFFVSEKDNGISDAFNKGIYRATGDIILLLNSDDYLLPGALSRIAMAYDGEYDLYSGNLLLWDESTGYKYRITPSLDFPVMPFFRKPVHQGLFVSKKLYESLGGYDIKIRYAMDLDFLMRATAHGAKFKYIDVDIAVFRLGGATSDSIFHKRKEYVYIVRKNGGTRLQAYTFYAFLVVTQTMKKLLRMSGIDVVRKTRYKSAK